MTSAIAMLAHLPRGVWLLIVGMAAALAGPCANRSFAQDAPLQPDADGKVLYLVEMVRPEKRGKEIDRLIRATLKRDGSLVSETVLTAKAGAFGDPAKVRIVAWRYIVTQYGGVVDVKEKQFINDRGSDLLGVENGQVYYRVYNYESPSFPGRKISKERLEQLGDFVFDLEKRTRARPEAKHWSMPDVKSPDRTKAVYCGATGVLWLDGGDGTPKELGKGFLVTHSKYAQNTFDRKVPILWLGNERILTQQANGKLVTLDMQGKVEHVCDIAGAPPVLDSPRLWLDPKGRIIYSCGRAEFVIDVKQKTASGLEEYALGHGFETPVETGARGYRTIYFKEQAISTSVFTAADVRTGPEVIAVMHLSDQGSRRWVGVMWTKLGFAWRGIDLDYGGVIGWVN